MASIGTNCSAVGGSNELVPGLVVADRYRLVSELGRGAMGVVWSAVSLATSEELALKILVEPDASLRRRLLREGRVCRDLRHPHVAKVYDVGETAAGQPFLVMERLRGETLADAMVRSPRLPEPTAAAIARDVTNAIAAAHALGVVHRDLKPANIFLHRSPGVSEVVVKVLDFGVCKVQESGDEARTEVGVPVGSLAYMAPEQAAGEADIDGRADVWSLGVVLFEMLAGRRLFSGSRMNIIRALLYDSLPSFTAELKGTDPGLPGIVARCLARERDERFATAVELLGALQDVCHDAEQREGPRTRVSFAERPSTPPAVPGPVPRGMALGSFRLVSAQPVAAQVEAAASHDSSPGARPPPLEAWPAERAVVAHPAATPAAPEPWPSTPERDLPGAPRPAATGTVKMGSMTLRIARDEALRNGASGPALPSRELVTAPTHPAPHAIHRESWAVARPADSLTTDAVGTGAPAVRAPSGLAALPAWFAAASAVAAVIVIGIVLLLLR